MMTQEQTQKALDLLREAWVTVDYFATRGDLSTKINQFLSEFGQEIKYNEEEHDPDCHPSTLVSLAEGPSEIYLRWFAVGMESGIWDIVKATSPKEAKKKSGGKKVRGPFKSKFEAMVICAGLEDAISPGGMDTATAKGK